MFFGREMKNAATYARKSDAINAARWIMKQSNRMVLRWELLDGGYVLSTDFFGQNIITVGYVSALMARHDRPPVLSNVVTRDGVVHAADIALVPFMTTLPYYDAMPGERP